MKNFYWLSVNFAFIKDWFWTIVKTSRLQPEDKELFNKFVFHRAFKNYKPADGFIQATYKYKGDGSIDWRPMTLKALASQSFRDDCDGFAQMAHFMHGDGKRYVIIPFDKSRKNHMVYVRQRKPESEILNVGDNIAINKIYSSGNIHSMTLSDYIEHNYDNRCYVVRQWI